MQRMKDLPPQVEAAMELTAVMAMSQVAEEEGRPPTDVLKEFLASDTADMLFSDDTKLWHDGPAYVAAEFLKERARRQKSSSNAQQNQD